MKKIDNNAFQPGNPLHIIMWTTPEDKTMYGSKPWSVGTGTMVRIIPRSSSSKKTTVIPAGQDIQAFCAEDLNEVDEYLEKNTQTLH